MGQGVRQENAQKTTAVHSRTNEAKEGAIRVESEERGERTWLDLLGPTQRRTAIERHDEQGLERRIEASEYVELGNF